MGLDPEENHLPLRKLACDTNAARYPELSPQDIPHRLRIASFEESKDPQNIIEDEGLWTPERHVQLVQSFFFWPFLFASTSVAWFVTRNPYPIDEKTGRVWDARRAEVPTHQTPAHPPKPSSLYHLGPWRSRRRKGEYAS